MKDDERVLDAIKRHGPISAHQLSSILKIPENKGVRPAIDSLRKKGERIWHDPTQQPFGGAMTQSRARRRIQDGSGSGRTTPYHRYYRTRTGQNDP